jgi:hypothetical protein
LPRGVALKDIGQPMRCRGEDPSPKSRAKLLFQQPDLLG